MNNYSITITFNEILNVLLQFLGYFLANRTFIIRTFLVFELLVLIEFLVLIF